jgi:hypothetical protein
MMTQDYALDRYVLDTLMADLVGHDHKPSAFLVYLAITAAHAEGARSSATPNWLSARACPDARRRAPWTS